MEGKGFCAIFQYGGTLRGTCHFQKNDQFMHLKWRKIPFKKKAQGVRYRTKHLTGLDTPASSRITYLDFSKSNARPPPPSKSPLPSVLLTKSHPTAREHSIAENVAARRYLQRAAESFKHAQQA